MKFLVTGANGDIGAAVGRVLRERYPDDQIDGVDAGGRLPGLGIFDRMFPIPLASSGDYLRTLIELSEGCDLVIPTSEPEILAIANSEPDFQLGDRALILDSSIVNTFCDKLSAYEWFVQNQVATPKTALLGDASPEDLPLLLKPRRGCGSRGIQVVENALHLEQQINENRGGDDFLAQEYLTEADEEYTCALFKFGGELRHIAMRRQLQGGFTAQAEVVSSELIDHFLVMIGSRIDFEGCLNVQFRMKKGVPVVFEINPRISSTVMMRHKIGFEDLVWWIESRMRQSVPEFRQPDAGTKIFRLSDEVAFDPNGEPVESVLSQ
ncbi:MAG: ATP-grasp domain-containing protein [Verrucomicrobiales bacterium]|nr:ATP-grasp domain-containing protein [Verrucomicrobiales bacterium]